VYPKPACLDLQPPCRPACREEAVGRGGRDHNVCVCTALA